MANIVAKLTQNKVKVMTSKQGKERLLNIGELYDKRSNKEFKRDFEYSFTRPIDKRPGAQPQENFSVYPMVQTDRYGFGGIK